MPSLYSEVCSSLSLESDAALLAEMTKANAAELAELEAAEKDAAENHGEVEVLEALLKKGKFFVRTGSKERALAVFKEASDKKSLSTGQRIELELDRIKLGVFWLDRPLLKAGVTEAELLLEKGGDWDRRNRPVLRQWCKCFVV